MGRVACFPGILVVAPGRKHQRASESARENKGGRKPKSGSAATGTFGTVLPASTSDLSKFDPDECCVFDAEVAPEIAKTVNELYAKEDLRMKVAALTEALQGNGSFTSLELSDFKKVCELGLFDDETGYSNFHDMEGSAASVCILKSYALRWAASQVPLIGFSSLLMACGDHMWVFGCSVSEMSRQGLTLDAAKNFFETESGQEFISQHCKLFPLKKDSVAYIPFGFAATVIVAPIIERGTEPPVTISHFVSQPVFVESWVDKNCEKFKAVMSHNMTYLESKKGGSHMATVRHAVVKKFADAVNSGS